MRLFQHLCAAALLLGFLVPVFAADKPTIIELWPGKVPGVTPKTGDEKITGKQGSRQLTNVTKPTITVFRPDKEKDTGTAIVIAPGGGYNILAWDHEGEEVATWLNSIGVTGVLLKYRVPRLADHPRYPLQDAQRALCVVRSRAKEWNLDPKRIGMLGFSAGGHLTAVVSTNFDKRAYEPVDEADQSSCRPDFAVLIYPGGIMPRGTSQLIPNVRVTKETPPAFLVHAHDDKGPSDQSVFMYLALKQAGVSAELHVYATGGHGFGMRQTKHPVAQWPKRCEEWLRGQGVLKPVTMQ